MASLGTWYSGNPILIMGKGIATPRLKVELLSQNASTNTSVIRYTSAVYWEGTSWAVLDDLYDTCAGVVLYNSTIQMAFTGNGLFYCITRDRTITHDANGNASFNAFHKWGDTGDGVGGTYTLPKISRDAYITNTPNFTVGQNVNLQISNPAGWWLWVDFFVWNGSTWNPMVMQRSIGSVTSFTTDFDSEDIERIYNQLGGASTGTGLFRIRAYDSGGAMVSQRDTQVTLTVDMGQRHAYITNVPNFIVGNNITVNIANPAQWWCWLDLYIWNGTTWEPRIGTRSIGQVLTYNFNFLEGEINAMYTQLKNSTSNKAILRIRAYTPESQLVNERDTAITVGVDTPINVPTFTNYDLVSEDKTITVKDAYNNTLGTTATNTLTGSNQKVISGVSQIKASITSANKMVAKNQADPVKYRLVNGEKLVDASYSASATVNLLLDNITSKDVVVSAYDSRGLATSVSKSFTNIANYTPPTAWSLAFTRDNNVDEKTKLSIGGKFWKQYFGGGTSGVQNTITAHYRYKETTQSWGSQTWNTLAVTSNAEGDISFNNYINGDLGVNGFNKDKSYSIEVRLYDKISALIVSGVLNKGTPLLDWTIDGVAIKSKYDPVKGGSLQVDGKSLLDFFYPIGTIYETTSTDLDTTTKMGTYFGGTWEAYGSGRVLVAKSADTEFDTIGETGGTKTHTLTVAEMPSHDHGIGGYGPTIGGENYYMFTKTVENYGSKSTQARGGGGSHNNLQPYIVVYRYRRVS